MPTDSKKNVVDAAQVPMIAGEGEQSAALVYSEEIAELNTMLKVSKELGTSGMFPLLKNNGQVLAVILAGRERGYGAMTSLMNIHLVHGRPGYSGQMIATELTKAGVAIDVIESTTTLCRIRFSREGKKPFEHEFTEADAKRAKKLPADAKSVWSTYPQDMLYWRCLTSGARRYAPDAIMGLYLADEIPTEPAKPVDERPGTDGLKARLGLDKDEEKSNGDDKPKDTPSSESHKTDGSAPPPESSGDTTDGPDKAEPPQDASSVPGGESEEKLEPLPRKDLIAELGARFKRLKWDVPTMRKWSEEHCGYIDYTHREVTDDKMVDMIGYLGGECRKMGA